MRQENGNGASCRLAADGARIDRTVPTDGKSDRHGHLTYGQAVEITRTLPRRSLYMVVSPIAFD
jgi:hypothetical protein